MQKKHSFLESARTVFKIEQNAIDELAKQLDDKFTQACQKILDCQGKIVVIGMGKSGHIGNKMAATLASTGTPAFFVHPAEASHGDLGMIGEKDLVIALSNSGETHEVTSLLPVIKRRGIPLISITGNPNSQLAKASQVHLTVAVKQEACPHNLAPTASTTAVLVLADAIAVSLLEARGFTADDFALSHPGGSLGKKLLLTVDDLMHAHEDFPSVSEKVSVKEALLEITDKRLGMTAVVNNQNQLLGIFTDGDLRRSLESGTDVLAKPIGSLMTKGCKTVSIGTLASEAVRIMQTNSINALIILNEQSEPVGALNMHDMLIAGIV